MKQTWTHFAMVAALGLGLVGCDGESGQGDDDAPGVDAQLPGTPDAGPGGVTWTNMIEGSWELTPGQEKYVCVTRTLTEDLVVGGYRPIAPDGTHHTVLSYGDPNGPDRTFDCGPGTDSPLWIYASGVGTNELILPTGVGVVIPKGKQLNLNLHLYNIGDGIKTGKSGVEGVILTAAQVQHEAELFLPGPLMFGPTATDTISGDCTAKANQTLVALFPHMHQKGKHFKTEVLRGGTVMATLYDKSYDFDGQEFILTDQLALQSGDKIRTTCQYTEAGVSWGNSSDEEMCFSILIRYPRLSANGFPFCTQ
jgi:hypothetical protein